MNEKHEVVENYNFWADPQTTWTLFVDGEEWETFPTKLEAWTKAAQLREESEDEDE